jgi:hypothetical protein
VLIVLPSPFAPPQLSRLIFGQFFEFPLDIFADVVAQILKP